MEEKLITDGNSESINPDHERMIKQYNKVAEERECQKVANGKWFCVDNVEYRNYGDNRSGDEAIEWIRDRFSEYEFVQRVNYVGTFYKNNGVITFVDVDGKKYVGLSNEENLDSLKNSNFNYLVRDSMPAPFSNEETPVDPEQHESFYNAFPVRNNRR